LGVESALKRKLEGINPMKIYIYKKGLGAWHPAMGIPMEGVPSRGGVWASKNG